MDTTGRYRLAALDMDGTLLDSSHRISPYTRAVLARAAGEDVLIALSTGRCRSELRTFLETVPGIHYVIGENGAWVYDVRNDRTIAQIAFPDDEVEYVFDAAGGFDALPQVFVGNQSYMPLGDAEALKPYHIDDFAGVFQAGSVFVDDIPALCRRRRGEVEKINLYFSQATERDCFLKRMAERPSAVSASIGIGCEISPPQANKAHGLSVLCAHLDLPLSAVMAVGDGGNDLDIMGAAGLPVAMRNAIEPVLALARAVTEDCDHDGAARAIERYMLSSH